LSHYFDVDGLRESIYAVISHVLASEQFVGRYGIGVEEAERIVTHDAYWGHTRSIVSNRCLEIAVKTRNAAEALRAKGIDYSTDKEVDVYNSGHLADGSKKAKDFIFICNKIIHAKEFRLDRQGHVARHKDLLWWGGMVTLEGTDQKNKEWCFFFIILDWCDSVLKFLNATENKLMDIRMSSYDLFNYQ